VAARGDVLALKRRLGFGKSQLAEHFLVVQADALNDVLETTLVVPLDAAFSYYTDYPGAIRIAAREAGTARDQVAVVTALASVDLTRFEDAPVTQVEPETLLRVDEMLAVVLELAR
jgi:mRNA-degrading endonuclease toxin of MazEF toxin-antitoxin module